MKNHELGLNKKSFSLFYNGGEIWCEHLDSMYSEKDLLIQKFDQDMVQISRPSTSSFIAVAIAQSEVDRDILEHIINSFIRVEKPLRKVVFIGLNLKMKSFIKKKNAETSFVMTCIDDFEKAKEWLV